MAAAARLVQKGGGEVQGCFTIIELSDLEVTNTYTLRTQQAA